MQFRHAQLGEDQDDVEKILNFESREHDAVVDVLKTRGENYCYYPSLGEKLNYCTLYSYTVAGPVLF